MITTETVMAFSITLLVCSWGCSARQKTPPRQMNQVPSPMADSIRRHERIQNKDVPGVSMVLNNVLSKPVEIYFAEPGPGLHRMDLLIHFHGASYVPKQAAYGCGQPLIVAIINLGSGSAVYENEFRGESVFPGLVETLRDSVSRQASTKIEISRVCLSSFSAGYGAVRAILKNHSSRLDGIVLLDGLHTDYVPPGRLLSQGGALNAEKLKGFLEFARLALEGKRQFLMTHSEIFPGTYASTTECADYLINSLHLQRQPVLRWGPGGMQMLSETRQNGLTILGFAGNSAPDHIDHLHGLPVFLRVILDKDPEGERKDEYLLR